MWRSFSRQKHTHPFNPLRPEKQQNTQADKTEGASYYRSHIVPPRSHRWVVQTETALKAKPSGFILPHFILAQNPGIWKRPHWTQQSQLVGRMAWMKRWEIPSRVWDGQVLHNLPNYTMAFCEDSVLRKLAFCSSVKVNTDKRQLRNYSRLNQADVGDMTPKCRKVPFNWILATVTSRDHN